MKVRQTVYNLMSTEMLNKRIDRLAIKLQNENDTMKKLRLLRAITDAADVVMRKNCFDEAFMKEIGLKHLDILVKSGI